MSDKESLPEGSSHDSTKELLEKNLKWAEMIYAQNKRINNKLRLVLIGSSLRFLLILIPIVLALIFVPPFLRSFSESYGSFIKTLGGGTAGKPTSNTAGNKAAPASQFDTLLKQFQNGQLQISPEMIQQVLRGLQQ